MDLTDEKDMKNLKEVMAVMSTEIPKLLESISKTMFSAENAAKLGEQTAEFYKKLKEAGMTDEQAFKLTQDFMANFSIGKMLGNIIGGGHGESDDELGHEIDKRIKKKIKDAMGDDDD